MDLDRRKRRLQSSETVALANPDRAALSLLAPPAVGPVRASRGASSASDRLGARVGVATKGSASSGHLRKHRPPRSPFCLVYRQRYVAMAIVIGDAHGDLTPDLALPRGSRSGTFD